MSQGALKKFRGEFRKFFEVNANGNTTYTNIWNTEKAVLVEREFIERSAHLKKTSISDR